MNTGKIYKSKKCRDFTVIDNNILRDKRLSWKAKGILCYLLSMPEDWATTQKQLVNDYKDGKDAVKSGMDELVEAGYVVKERNREEGKFKGMNYIVYDSPNAENPISEKPISENPPLLSKDNNKELNVTKEKKENKKEKKADVFEEELKSEAVSKETKSEFENMNKYIKSKLHSLKKINNQMTLQEYAKLKGRYTKSLIKLKMDALDNHKNCKNYKSVYMTVNNWCRMEVERQNPQPKGETEVDGSEVVHTEKIDGKELKVFRDGSTNNIFLYYKRFASYPEKISDKQKEQMNGAVA